MHNPFGSRILNCRDPSAGDLRHFAAIGSDHRWSASPTSE
jgi:hypothetical protein